MKSEEVMYLTNLLFIPEQKDLDIAYFYNEQYKRTGSGSFVYKGETYLSQGQSKPLHKDLKPAFKKFLEKREHLAQVKSKLFIYLRKNMQHVKDIFWLMPEFTHDTYSQLTKPSTPDTRDKPKDYQQIHDILSEIYLMRML